MMKRILFAAALASSVAFPITASKATELWGVTGFDMPESVLVDEKKNRLIVSSIIGHPRKADGKGALSILSKDGKMIKKDWVTGLDAPKGMGILGNTLLVTDLTKLHMIDLETGAIIKTIEPKGAVFLNDISTNNTTAFISDLMTNTIWTLDEEGTATIFLKSDDLNHPNGVFVDGDRLLVGTWGKGMKADFSTEVPGSLIAIFLADKSIKTLAADVGNIDGIDRVGSAIVFNDWVSGDLFSLDANGVVKTREKRAQGLADISADGTTIYLPEMLKGKVTAITLD